MPTILTETRAQTEAEASDLLHPETGELTLETQVYSDFLTHADFSGITDVDGIDDFAFEAEVENPETGVVEKLTLLPGKVVADLVDENDLQGMFEHYIQQLADSITSNKDATLEEKARLAPFAELIEFKGHKRGDFSRMHRQPAGHNRAARQMTAMLYKGAIVHTKKGKGQGKNKDYKRGKGYSSGGTPAGKKLVARWKAKSGSKLRKAAVKAKQKVKESVTGFDVESTPIWGLGAPVEQANYVTSFREDAGTKLADMKKAALAEKSKCAADDDEVEPDADDADDTDDADEGVKMRASAGMSVTEGAGLAGAIMRIQGTQPTAPAQS